MAQPLMLPKTTLIENPPGTRMLTPGAPTLDALMKPLPIISISAERANYEPSTAYPGRQRVASFVDELTGAIYPPIADPSFFDLLTPNGYGTLEGKVPAATARGYRLPIDAIQGKAGLTFGSIVCNLVAPPGGGSQRVYGSTTNSSGANEMLFLSRGGDHSIGAAARLSPGGSATSAGNLPAAPVGKWHGLILTLGYAPNLTVRLERVSSDGSFDGDTGTVVGPVNPSGVSPTVSGAGLAVGGVMGSSNTSTAWDGTRYTGGFYRFDLFGAVLSDVPFANSLLSRRGLLREQYRSICAILNR